MASTLLKFVQGLAWDDVQPLYADVWICRGMLRALQPLAQQYVLRLLFTIPDEVGAEDASPAPTASGNVGVRLEHMAKHWVQANAIATHKQALKHLRALSICRVEPDTTDTTQMNVRLSVVFGHTLRRAFALVDDDGDDGQAWDEGALPTDPTPRQLHVQATHAWDTLLNYMADPEAVTGSQGPPDLVVKLLFHRGLLSKSASGDGVRIMNQGFQFLLKDTHTQLWSLLVAYVQLYTKNAFERKAVLSFLFRLSFLHAGYRYTHACTSVIEERVLSDMHTLGLLWCRKDVSTGAGDDDTRVTFVYWPTPLVRHVGQVGAQASSTGEQHITPQDGGGNGDALGDDAAELPVATTSWTEGSRGSGWIVLEGNYKIYGYTSSPLRIRLLDLFASLEYRLPNLVVGTITRASALSAFRRAISAAHIIAFLRQNAHPKMREMQSTSSDSSIIPETVVDQLKIWESERLRISLSSPGRLYYDFPSESVFKEVLSLAQAEGVLIWSNADKGMIMVKPNEAVRQILSQYNI